MSEESNEKAKSQRELLREKSDKHPHMKQHQLNNGWKLYTNAEFSFWDKDHDYVILDEDFDAVFVFNFKEDTIKVKRSANWNIEFTFNMKKKHIKVFRTPEDE